MENTEEFNYQCKEHLGCSCIGNNSLDDKDREIIRIQGLLLDSITNNQILQSDLTFKDS